MIYKSKETGSAPTGGNHMKKIYICSPFWGTSNRERNIAVAISACQKVVNEQCEPLAPHLYFPMFLDDSLPEQREIGIMFGLTWLEGCDEMWVIGSIITEGMEREIRFARNRGIHIKHVPVGTEI